MLSVAPIKSAAAAVAYFEKDDYYSKGEGEGNWYGKGAEGLGLSGPITREAFTEILEGRLPDGTILGRMRDGELEHRPGWDLTFSAPKSVSVAAEIGGDERLFDAHDAAAKAALDWLQQNAAANVTRGVLGQKTVQTDNLVVAMFRHETSREQDPQLHTHSVVANATLRPDGKWVSLDSRDLFTYKMAAGNIYRAELAQQVQKLGYNIELTGSDGRFELRGVAPELLEEFSTRRAQIVAAMEARGTEGAVAAAHATLMTRANKVDLPREELAADWHARAAPFREGLNEVIEGAKTAGDVRNNTLFRVDKAVEKAVDRLSESEAVFTRAELIRWSLANSMGRSTVGRVESEINLLAGTRSLEKTSLGRLQAYTTPRAKEQERRVTEAVSRGQNAVPRMADNRALKAALEGSTLGVGQRGALELIATSRDRFVGIVGRPGTGKSFLMAQTRELLENQGRTLRGMAQNSEAARKLQLDSGIISGTLNKALDKAFRDLNAIRSAPASPSASALNQAYAGQVWVLDEATQVGSKQMRRLTFAAEKLGFRVVMIGDPQQLAAIDAGKPFELMLRAGMRNVELDEIRRQQNPEHLKAVRQAIKGNVSQALQTLSGDTVQISDRQARLNAIVAVWRGLGEARADTFILTSGNAEKSALNDGARDVLRAEGRLAGETAVSQLGRVFSRNAERKDANFYKPGDLVRFGWDLKSQGIKGGSYLRVAGVDRDRQVVQLERPGGDGKADIITWNPSSAGGKRAAELFRPRETSIAPGETIRWTRNDGTAKLNNGQILTVTAVWPGKIEVRTGEGDLKTIDASARGGQHWEHAYASTVYSSQGGTAKHVLVNAEGGKAELFNQKAFLVAISRQKYSLTLFTDNNEQFQNTVEKHLGIKTSAIESRDADNLVVRMLRSIGWVTAANKELSMAEKQHLRDHAHDRSRDLER